MSEITTNNNTNNNEKPHPPIDEYYKGQFQAFYPKLGIPYLRRIMNEAIVIVDNCSWEKARGRKTISKLHCRVAMRMLGENVEIPDVPTRRLDV